MHIQHDIFPQGCRSHLCCDRCVCLCVSLIYFAAPLGGAAWALSSVPLSHCSLFQRYIYMLAAACVASRCCLHLRRLLSPLTPLLACPQPIGVCLALWGRLPPLELPPLCADLPLVLWGYVFSPEGHFICTVLWSVFSFIFWRV